jgi:hypothetical protein
MSITEEKKTEIIAKRDEYAQRDPSNLTPEEQINTIVCRGSKIIDYFMEQGYTRSSADTTACAGAVLYAAGLLLVRSGLSPQEVQMILAAGVVDAARIAGMAGVPTDEMPKQAQTTDKTAN